LQEETPPVAQKQSYDLKKNTTGATFECLDRRQQELILST